ncbi:Predicted arabinose efflux permease, MFS family [Streptomyces sp. 1222.5]|uniref:MFS transporter n=1 Tax=unclassified Streptomyces TaxID=2593676 RepID=UPI00089D1C75|nr:MULTISPECIES: MFS transporter [unclassified Streptomyces]PKW12253.1 putative MFS family arabinose efflux permease [Streptomyces sp. 5112.2]SEB59690.1 Predicted arabinose efflux permease, MFS family [Streptomyces sp. 1222.5]
MRSGHRLERLRGHRLGRPFGWLWAAYGTSALGTWLAFGAVPLIAVHVLRCGPAEVAALSSVGAAVGAAVAVPLGPWVEFRRKRQVLIATDLVRFAALLTIPAAFALGALTFVQLMLVSIVVAAADITFRAASGAYLKALLPAEDLLVANARFESTSWTTTIIGPPLGGVAIGLLGPLATVVADAVSYLLSALGLRAMGGAMGGHEPRPEGRRTARLRAGELLDGWRYLLTDVALRPLFFNTALFNGLVMATQPLLAVLMLGRLGFSPWQYGLAFAAPSIGGLVGSRLARPLVTRFGQHQVLVVTGALRALWPVGLAFLGPGTGGLVLVMGVEFGLIFCCGVFNPVCTTFRLGRTATDRVTRTLTAWAVSTKAATALLTALWGVLGSLLGPRTAIGLAGVFLLATPLLLPRRAAGRVPEPAAAPNRA